MQKVHKTILPVLVSTLTIVALAMTPALAKDSRNKKSIHSSASTKITEPRDTWSSPTR